jgi:ATP-dependent protease HslVU (ClpYQ) peptidase subunit
MTAIVAYIQRESKTVWICEDSIIIGANGDTHIGGVEKTIFDGNISYSISGDVSFINTIHALVLTKKIKKPAARKSPLEWVVSTLLPVIKEHKKEDEFDMIVSVGMELFIISNDLSVVRPIDEIASIGSAGVYAEMAMRGALEFIPFHPEVFNSSFTIAEERNKYMAAPYKIYRNGKVYTTF